MNPTAKYGMTKIKRVYVFACALWLIFGCQERAHENREIAMGNPTTVEINAEKIVNLEISKIATEMNYVFLSNDYPESLIGDIDKLLMHEGKFFIMDKEHTQSIFVFDTSGQFVYRIGPGKGPGEFTSIEDFCIDTENNMLYVLSNDLSEIFKYNMVSGDFVSSIKMKSAYDKLQVITSNKILLLRDGHSYESSPGPFSSNFMCTIDSLGNWIEGWHLSPINPNVYSGLIHVVGNGERDGYTITRMHSDTIYQYDGADMEVKYLLDCGPKRLLDEFYWTSSSKRQGEIMNQSTHFLGNVIDIRNFSLIQYVHNRRYYTYYYDKTAKEGFTVNYVNDIDHVPILQFDCALDSLLVHVMQPQEIELQRNYIVKSGIESKKMQEIAGRIDYDSNPVLMIATLR